MEMSVDLGSAAKFTRFSEEDRRFYTIGSYVEKADIGAHNIVIEAKFWSPFGTFTSFQNSF